MRRRQCRPAVPACLVLAAFLGACLATAATTGAAAADEPSSPSGGASVEVGVAIPDGGSLGISVAHDSIDLGTAEYDAARAGWVARGPLPEVTVTDTRVAAPGWTLSAAASDLVPRKGGGTKVEGAGLSLAPFLVGGGSGEPAVTLADEVANLLDPQGQALAWTRPGDGRSTTGVGGDLELSSPADTPAGDYVTTLTITVS